MRSISRRELLAASAAVATLPHGTWAQGTALPAGMKPRVTVISQWAAGSDGAAITALGKVFTQNGGIWQHSPVPGFTTDMMNKLRAEIIAGDPPAASQLKGPEIAAWSKIAPTVDLDALVAAAQYESVLPADLSKLHKPEGHWIALPLQVYRINTLWVSKKAMAVVGATKLPATWAEFNELATKMKAAGITPVANGGVRWDDGMKFEICLAGISPAAYRRALMELDADTLKGPDVVAAFAQLRKLADWMDPNVAAQDFTPYISPMIQGRAGMMLMGGWLQGMIAEAGYHFSDYVAGPAPQDKGQPCFVLNADSFIFWKQKQPDLQAGQTVLANLIMSKDVQRLYSQITGSIPVRTDMDLSGAGWSPEQTEMAQALKQAVANNQVVLSLAHNMAQPNQVTAAMIDVLTEFVHNEEITAQQGADRLAEAVENAR
jgi:glucose/mannose transport system substrate-binding protein